MSRRRFDRRHVLVALGAVALFALVLRFVTLGWRVFHWDEARVGYWTLRYLETGVWEYRAIVHGPLLFHVNEFLFGIFGAGDAVASWFVALVGGLLPLTAWLFRSRLDDLEVVLVGILLAVDPVLLYYSRFMRNDVLVAGFSLLVLGFAVRLIETRRQRYLYGAVLALGLAFGTKEIALVYVGVWIGALALLLDYRLFVARQVGESWVGRARSIAVRGYAALRAFRGPLSVGTVEFLAIVVVLYAPRPDVYRAITDPSLVPDVLQAATIGSAHKLIDIWIQGGHEHSYVAYLTDMLETTAFVSLPLVGFAGVGFLADRYTGDSPRDLVSFSFYWGATVFLLYPAITDISAPWSLVHALVPLSIPAAVGLGIVLDRAHFAWKHEDRIGIAIAALVIIAVIGHVGITAAATSFQSPQSDDNPLVQYGQPAGHLQETLAEIESIARENEGTDVVFYGDHFAVPEESVADQPPASSNWLNRLPLAWYLERAHASTASATTPGGIAGDPPVVIARVEHYSELADRLEGYDARTYEITASGTETIFFIENSTTPRT
ncbi:MAG: TIGR03663 family protein [Halodesulfurarchaeum sp.]|nr:TIGR03663 family protein [Halodesulfurarchaeum sp.]